MRLIKVLYNIRKYYLSSPLFVLILFSSILYHFQTQGCLCVLLRLCTTTLCIINSSSIFIFSVNLPFSLFYALSENGNWKLSTADHWCTHSSHDIYHISKKKFDNECPSRAFHSTFTYTINALIKL